jgi:hypothetical protein
MTALHTSISGPFRHENLDIFLFRGFQSLPERHFLPLHEALQQQKVVVHETGNVGQLEVENHSDLDLFIQAGDVVKGGRQDRTLGVDLVVSAHGGRVPVPAFCVESRRWHKRRNESDAVFTKSDTVLSNKALRLSTKLKRDQSAVWQSIASFQKTMGEAIHTNLPSDVSPSSYQLSMEHGALQKGRHAYREALEPALSQCTDAIGFAFAINGKPNTADFYGSADLFRRLWSRQLDAAITEAVMEAPTGKSPKQPVLMTESIEQWLESTAPEQAPKVQEVCAGVWLHTAEKRHSVVFDTVLSETASPVLHRNIISID